MKNSILKSDASPPIAQNSWKKYLINHNYYETD